jgi:aspartyl-tRNA(Asn)/glutamyl-tRNA(Gln) amidotransferase subunit C
MAKLTKTDILHIADLSKLTLNETEIDKFIPQLTSIIDYIGHLDEVDTKDIETTAQVTGLESVTRPDLIKSEKCLTQEEAISGSDKIYNGYFVVPAILSERTDK